jgi:hypothetical protein
MHARNTVAASPTDHTPWPPSPSALEAEGTAAAAAAAMAAAVPLLLVPLLPLLAAAAAASCCCRSGSSWLSSSGEGGVRAFHSSYVTSYVACLRRV